MRTKPLAIILLFILSGIFYYNFTDNINIQTFRVQRIIDGDTIELENQQTVRLLGINTPESQMPYYQEAKQSLINLIENKSVQIELRGTDKYGRTLVYVFLDNKNINEELLSQGLATLYFYGEDQYYEKFRQTEESARINEKGLWGKSPDSNCIEIIKFETNEPESLILQNLCNKKIHITYKDDATHTYQTTINPKSFYIKNFSHIWNTEGDSIYIRDEKGLLLFYRY